jgi:hypothetical protein
MHADAPGASIAGSPLLECLKAASAPVGSLYFPDLQCLQIGTVMSDVAPNSLSPIGLPLGRANQQMGAFSRPKPPSVGSTVAESELGSEAVNDPLSARRCSECGRPLLGQAMAPASLIKPR